MLSVHFKYQIADLKKINIAQWPMAWGTQRQTKNIVITA
jgi:hypothetical protein